MTNQQTLPIHYKAPSDLRVIDKSQLLTSGEWDYLLDNGSRWSRGMEAKY